MAPPVPVAGYSFDAQDGTDDVGAYDITNYGDWTASAKHGAYALASDGEEMFAVPGEDAGTGTVYSLAAWLYVPPGEYTQARASDNISLDYIGRVTDASAFCTVDGSTPLVSAANAPTADAWNLLVWGQRADGKLWLSLNGGTIAVAASASTELSLQRWALEGEGVGIAGDTFAIWDAELDLDDITWLWNDGDGRQISELSGGGAGTDELTAFGLETGAPVVAGLTLQQTHALVAAGVATAAPSVAATELAQVHALSCAAVNVGAPDVPALGLRQAHALSAAAVSTGPPAVARLRLFLGTLVPPATRSATVPAEVRRVAIADEVRTAGVAAEVRAALVAAEVRTHSVAFENRTTGV